jgi:hypothetical protein
MRLVGRSGDKGEWWREWIQIGYIIRTFVNATMHSRSAQ